MLLFEFMFNGNPWYFIGGLIIFIILCFATLVAYDITLKALPKIIHGEQKIVYINIDKKEKDDGCKKCNR